MTVTWYILDGDFVYLPAWNNFMKATAAQHPSNVHGFLSLMNYRSDHLSNEFNASYKHTNDFIEFDSEQDLIMFLLRFSS